MGNLIFTADDYGIIDAIDTGVCKAISKGWLNSVEVFPNDREKVKRSVARLGNIDLKDYASTQGIAKRDAIINVGAHLTITSGQPLTETHFFKRTRGALKGSFRKWTDFKRPKRGERVKEIRQLEDEILEQIDTLQTEVDKYPTLHLNHLSSHHNSLYYFEDYAMVLYEIAKNRGLAVRTPIGRPKIKDNLFYHQLNIRLTGNLNDDDLDHMWNFHKEIEDFLGRQKSLPKMTQFHNNVHYGPPPFIKLDAKGMVRKARSKFKKVNKWLGKHQNDSSVEFVFHLIDYDPAKLDEYEKQANTAITKYPGINPKYFDGRMAEYLSLMNIMKNDPSIATRFINWSNL